MSKFIDKLNQVSQAVPQPVGFRPKQPVSSKPKILLVASLARANVENLADYVAGADAGLLHISELSSGAKTLKKISQVVPDIPWGGWLRASGRGRTKQTVKAGCDFVVFSADNTSLAIFQGEEVGKILEVEPSLGEGLLRAVDELPVDAVLIGSEQAKGHFLTWHHLMLFKHFAGLLTKPLLVSVPLSVTAGELQALWEAGVDGVVVQVGVGQPAERLKELRQVIDKLVPPSPRKPEKPRPLLPYIARETRVVTEEEEEE
ncbi:MAG: hypothetical protein ACETVS_01300 [Dehalococcoidales bacterium]